MQSFYNRIGMFKEEIYCSSFERFIFLCYFIKVLQRPIDKYARFFYFFCSFFIKIFIIK